MRKARWMMMLTGALIAGGFALNTRNVSGADDEKPRTYPEPSVSSRAWRFDFSYDTPKPIHVKQSNGTSRWYWYMTYKVTNNSGTERIFVPDITVVTDTGETITAGKDVPVGVYTAIKDSTGNRLLESPILVVGRLLQGEDNSRESVAIWPANENGKDVDQFKIFVAGISGELAVTQNPKTSEDVVLRRTLMLTFDLPGTNVPLQKQPVVPKGKEWVMR